MEEEAARYNHQIVRVGPVWAAAHAGDVKRLTEALLKSGSTEETACDRKTPLLIAASLGHLDSVNLLVRVGANIRATTSGRTALHLAVLGRHVDVVNVLLVSGIDVNAVERKDRWTALDYAKKRNFCEIVDAFQAFAIAQ